MAMGIRDENWKPNGYFADATITSSTALTVPSNSRMAIIQAITDDIYWTDDGTTPVDTTTGMLLAAGDSFMYLGDLSAFRCISDAGAIRVSFYK